MSLPRLSRLTTAILMAYSISFGIPAASALAADSIGGCGCAATPWRSYDAPVSADVEALWKAAAERDEIKFMQLVGKVGNLAEYAVGDRTILWTLLRPAVPDETGRTANVDNIVSEHRSRLPALCRMVSAAIAAGADVTAVTRSGQRSPLQLAMIAGSPEIVAMLLAAGAYPAEDDRRHSTAFALLLGPAGVSSQPNVIELVTRAERTAMLKALLDAKAVHDAANGGDEPSDDEFSQRELGVLVSLTEGADIVRRFVKAFPDAIDPPPYRNDQPSPITLAAYWGNEEAVIELLALLPSHVKGISGGPRRDQRVEAALAAAAGGFSDLAKRLVQPGAPLGQAGPYHLDFLASAGKQVNVPVGTLVQAAIAADDAAWLRELIAKGAPVNAVKGAATSPLHDALAGGKTEMAELLLTHGADPMQKVGDIPSVLMQAAEAGDIERMALLLSHLKVALRDRSALDVREMLDAVAKSGDMPDADQQRLVDALSKAGFDPKLLTSDALDLMIDQRKFVIARAFVLGGMPVTPGEFDEEEFDDDHMDPPLLSAIDIGNGDLVALLLAHGADPNRPCKGEITPLAGAARRGDIATIDRLLAAGAKVGGPEPAKRLLAEAVGSGDIATVDKIVALTGATLPELCEAPLVDLEKAVYGPAIYLDSLLKRGLPLGTACKTGRFSDWLLNAAFEKNDELSSTQQRELAAQLRLAPDLARANFRLRDGVMPPHEVAMRKGRPDLTAALLTAGVRPDQHSVWHSIASGQAEVLGQFVKHGVNLSDKLPNGLTIAQHMQCKENPAFRHIAGVPEMHINCAAIGAGVPVVGQPRQHFRPLAGEYRAKNATSSSLLHLRDDGTFQLVVEQNLIEEKATGFWKRSGQSVVLESDADAGANLFDIADARHDRTAGSASVRFVTDEPAEHIELFNPADGKVVRYEADERTGGYMKLPWAVFPHTVYVRHKYTNHGRWYALTLPEGARHETVNKVAIEPNAMFERSDYPLFTKGTLNGKSLLMAVGDHGTMAYKRQR